MINKAYNILVTTFVLLLVPCLAFSQQSMFRNWDTNLNKKSINLGELRSGGPPKDGIPAISNPKFISPSQATWLKDQEPVISLEYKGVARAYPLQIMIYHEIVNDRIKGDPILVTFCPLCYSAISFSRIVNGETLSFGVSGFLRHSDMVMFDRKTESLWQQFNGKGIVGDYTGTELEKIPSQLISFKQFKESYPSGEVLSRDTGHRRNYGTNPYRGYDNINNSPFLMREEPDSRLPPMEKVVGVELNGKTKTYPYSITKEQKVINDQLAGSNIVVFHTEGATSALDAGRIAQSKEAGSTGVFKSTVNGRTLSFEYKNGEIVDQQTGSVWNITGKSIEGELKNTQLERVKYGDYFAFAWLVFYTDTSIYSP